MTNTIKKNIGRPRAEMPLLPIFDSMAGCAAMTGISVSRQRMAKRAGCRAFRSNRVCLATLLRWLFANDDDSRIDWDRRWRKARAQREEINLMRDKGTVATREFFGGLLRTLAIKQKEILARHVTPEVLAEICREMQSLANQFPADGGFKENP